MSSAAACPRRSIGSIITVRSPIVDDDEQRAEPSAGGHHVDRVERPRTAAGFVGCDAAACPVSANETASAIAPSADDAPRVALSRARR